MTRQDSAWRVRLAGSAGSTVVTALLRTITFAVDADRDAARLMERGDQVIYAHWHSGILALAFRHRGQGAAVLVSQHRDGEIIARILAEFGYVTARGSTTRACATGLRGLIRRAREGRSLAVTPDGPQGPREVAQAGVAALASLTDLPIIPVGLGCDRSWEIDSWDRFLVPKPFARVCLRYGRPVRVQDASDEALAFVQAALDSATSAARFAATTQSLG